MDYKEYKLKAHEGIDQAFARVILQAASEKGLTIRDLEAACDIAIRYCREALVPTPLSPQTD